MNDGINNDVMFDERLLVGSGCLQHPGKPASSQSKSAAQQHARIDLRLRNKIIPDPWQKMKLPPIGGLLASERLN